MTEFLSPYDQRLRTKSTEVSIKAIQSGAVQNLIDTMLLVARGERDEEHPERKSMVGLAAPQIGEFERVILIDAAADPGVPNFQPDLRVFINPIIVEKAELQVIGREGCYSTGEICGAVYRAASVKVHALNEAGEEFTYNSKNRFQARILQHEIDHLNGIRFPEHIIVPEHLHRVHDSEFQDYRENWRHWQHRLPVEEWRKMYNGIDEND